MKSIKVAGFPLHVNLDKDKGHPGAEWTKGPQENNALRALRKDLDLDGLHIGNIILGLLTEKKTESESQDM